MTEIIFIYLYLLYFIEKNLVGTYIIYIVEKIMHARLSMRVLVVLFIIFFKHLLSTNRTVKKNIKKIMYKIN